MGVAYSAPIIKSAFRDNGQIDESNEVLPNAKALIGTYRGAINENHYLHNTFDIIKCYYKETFLNGRIKEDIFDTNKVINDCDSKGEIVNRDFDISRENCQRAKVLSAQTQRNERIALIKNIQEAEREKQISLFDTETKKYELNDICEKRIVNMFYSTTTQQDRNKQIDATIRKTFTEITTDFKNRTFWAKQY